MPSPPHASEAAHITRIEPLWRALGVSQTRSGSPRYWLEINGAVRSFRAGELWGYPFLAEVYPDLGYWQMLFPQGRGHQIDRVSAMRHFVRACEKAGVYVPVVGAVSIP